jgi:hypothetical protein
MSCQYVHCEYFAGAVSRKAKGSGYVLHGSNCHRCSPSFYGFVYCDVLRKVLAQLLGHALKAHGTRDFRVGGTIFPAGTGRKPADYGTTLLRSFHDYNL